MFGILVAPPNGPTSKNRRGPSRAKPTLLEKNNKSRNKDTKNPTEDGDTVRGLSESGFGGDASRKTQRPGRNQSPPNTKGVLGASQIGSQELDELEEEGFRGGPVGRNSTPWQSGNIINGIGGGLTPVESEVGAKSPFR